MTCHEAIALLAEYLDRELAPEHIARIEQHLAICASCRAYFATYDKTRELAARVQQIEMPAGMKERLRRLLLDADAGAG